MILDKGLENKKLLTKLAKTYKIKYIVISLYNAKANEHIKQEHLLVVNTLSKITNEGNKR